MMYIDGPTFKIIRESLNLSQTEAAQRVGISQPYINMLERGVRKLNSKLRGRLLRAYNLDLNAIADGDSTRSGVSLEELKRRMIDAQRRMQIVQQMFENITARAT